jgi:hypothetical protein
LVPGNEDIPQQFLGAPLGASVVSRKERGPNMGQDDITTEQSQTSRDDGREAGCTRGTGARGAREGLPLFKRFGVAKEWRVKDGAVG